MGIQSILIVCESRITKWLHCLNDFEESFKLKIYSLLLQVNIWEALYVYLEQSGRITNWLNKHCELVLPKIPHQPPPKCWKPKKHPKASKKCYFHCLSRWEMKLKLTWKPQRGIWRWNLVKIHQSGRERLHYRVVFLSEMEGLWSCKQWQNAWFIICIFCQSQSKPNLK